MWTSALRRARLLLVGYGAVAARLLIDSTLYSLGPNEADARDQGLNLCVVECAP